MFLDTRKVLEYSDLQRTYNWDVLLPDIANISGEAVSQFIQEIDFGEYSLDDTNPLRHGAYQTHSAGFLSIKPVTIGFLSPVSNIVAVYFEKWKALIVSPQGFYFPKKNYADFSATASLYNNAGELAASYRLANIFPKTFPTFKLSYSEENMVKFNLEFSIDFIERIK